MSTTEPAATAIRAVIVGAGPAGSLMAIHLARRGWSVEVIERRPDPRDRSRRGEGRSINLGLSARGIDALRRVGLFDRLAPQLVPMRGRAIHRRDGSVVMQPYGTAPHEQLHSVLREDLNALLLSEAAEHESVRLIFDATVTGVDLASGSVTYVDGGEEHRLTGDLLVGADGVASAIRSAIQDAEVGEVSREPLPWGYKELTIPVGDDGKARTTLEALHVWPGERGLMVGHPNVDGSITCTMFLAYDGPGSFAELTDEAAVTAFVADHFPDALELMPDLATEFLANPVGHLLTIRTHPWRSGRRAVLLGDAAHAVYPFYGQGMNSALEDCTVLTRCLDENDDLVVALAEFERLRKPHLDVLADLSTQNFEELRDHVASPVFRLRKRLDMGLHRLAPQRWRPLYTLVSHTTTPYGDAVTQARRQDRVLDVGIGLVGVAVVASISAVGRCALSRSGWSRGGRS